MAKQLSQTERQRINIYLAKLKSVDKYEKIKAVAIANWSIGTKYLKIYIIFNRAEETPKEITDIIDTWQYNGLSGHDSGMIITTELDDEFLPGDITYFYKKGETVE